MVQQQRDEVLSANTKDMKDLADVIDAAIADGKAREGAVTATDLMQREGLALDGEKWVSERVFED